MSRAIVWSVFVCAVLGGCSPRPGLRQVAPGVSARAILEAPASSERDVRGRITSWDETSLHLVDGPDTTRLARSSIRRLETFVEARRRTSDGLLIGGLGGLLTGVLVGSAIASDDENYIVPPAAVLGIAGAAGGTLVGGIVGWNMVSEVWAPLVYPAPGSGGSAAVGVRVRVGR